MGWMKWVATIATQNPGTVSSLRSKINKAKQGKLNYCVYDGEILTLEQAEAMITLIVKHKKEHDQVRREPDTVQQQD
jgi:hypothetical protein